MLENVPTWLKVTGGIFLTVLLITFVVGFVMFAMDKSQEGREEVTGVFNNLTDAKYTMYSRGPNSGSEVINAIRQYSSRPQFGIKVITGKGDTSFYGNTFQEDGTVSTTNKITDYSKAEDPSSPAYINLSGNFEPKIVRDANSVVVGLIFTQRK
ncbi:ABC transporter permease [Paenibacillus sp. UMB7766-LJ446]|uniref:ABC transporter permease n=1 Tax=Paenibacillus TaxID=44249 RepID=UPI00254B9ADC|nr:ABC transporter permease [Paenibacillus sp. UMB7766-LJ446]MDK8193265.1 ABC transporter permease [Paenibacillus sp. UMB7766-LJ446]